MLKRTEQIDYTHF